MQARFGCDAHSDGSANDGLSPWILHQRDEFPLIPARLISSAYDTSMTYRACVKICRFCTQQIFKLQSQPALTSVNPVLYKLFFDKWDGVTQVVPGLPGSGGAGAPPVIVGRR